MDYHLVIDVLGLDKDIAAFWKKWTKANGLGIDFDGEPSGNRGEGDIDDIPDQETFNAIFESYPALSFCFTLYSYSKSLYGYRFCCNESNEYDGEIYEGIFDDDEEGQEWLESYREFFRSKWALTPNSLRTKENALKYMKADDTFFEEDRLPKEYWGDQEFCLAAVEQNSDALEYVPKKLQAQIKKAAGIEDESCRETESRN